MTYLAKRDHSELELRTKLAAFFSLEAIDSAIDYAKKRGWLLPPEDLSIKVTDSLNRQFKGKNYIKNYLLKKGLPYTAPNDQVELEKALHLVDKKFGQETPTLEERNKAIMFLRNKGFSLNAAIQALDSLNRAHD